jgi:serine/threonine-protein kinase
VYRLIGRLEQGQLADLFRAERVDGGERVVVKLFHPRTSDAAYARIVIDTARQLQAIAHPGVARVLQVGLVDGRLAIVRQDSGRYTLGLALQRLNTREVFLPPALALALVLDLLDVVGAAHAAGVVHGALTPGNVGLAENGTLAVSDFGALAALLAVPSLKRAFAGRGRSSYRAPELSTGGAAAPASDVYAVGAMAYELLTLREASTGNAAVSIRAERLPPPSRLVRRLHSRIDPVIMRALEPSPARRHRSCADFADGLREFLAASGGIPPREDLEKFVGELFPNEVQLAALGPVPFERAFELTDIDGVGTFEADAPDADERPSFSGGYVDDRTPTSDGLPVFTDQVPAITLPGDDAASGAVVTQREVTALAPRLTWDAPAAEVPPPVGPVPPRSEGEAVKQRVRVVEDFGAASEVRGPPRPEPPRPVAKTLMTFVVPFKRHGDPEIPNYAGMEERARRRTRVASVLGAVALVGTVSFAMLFWYFTQDDPLASFVSYLPKPIQREIKLAPRPPPPPPAVGTPPKPVVKLQQFDKLHPDKAFDPNPPPEQVDPPPRSQPRTTQTGQTAPKPASPGAPRAGCYEAGKGPVAYLSVVSSARVKVEIDGRPVCEPATKIPVAPGSRRVRVTEPRTRQTFDSQTRFEAGKVVKLTPVFDKR